MHRELSANGITSNEMVDSKSIDAVLDGSVDLEYDLNGDT
jgi:hypothetical protein